MTVSGADPRRLSAAAACAAALLLIAVPSAFGQQPVGAPLRLGPPPTEPTPGATPSQSDVNQPLAPPPLGPSQAPLPASESVEVAPLAAIDPDNLGVRAAAGDRFSPDLWARTPRDVATVLLQRLPGALASASLRDLQHRLLMAAAKAPEGNAPAGAPRLIALRIAKLIEMGDPESAEALTRMLSPKLDDEPIMRVRVEQLLLADKRDEACAEVTRQLARFPNVFWQQAQVACQATTGQDGPAGLGAQLLREQGFDNPGFFNLLDMVSSPRKLPLDKLGPVTPTTLMLLRAAKRDVPADSLAASAPGVLRALALAPEIPLPTRLAAGERAVSYGALTPETLGQLYLALDAPPADVANAAALAKSDKSPRARAVLFHAVRAQTDAVARAELMRAAFDSARAVGLFAATAALYRPTIEELPPSGELAVFAGDAARALLVVGAIDQARRWYELVRARAASEGDAATLQAQLWVLFHVAGADDAPLDAARLLGWYDAQPARTPSAVAERAALVYGLLGALGERVPSGAWLPLALDPAETTRPVPATSTLLELGSATTDARLGEAVALAATTIGARDPSTAGTLACTGVTAALRGLGLTQAARRFALETALAAGA